MELPTVEAAALHSMRLVLAAAAAAALGCLVLRLVDRHVGGGLEEGTQFNGLFATLAATLQPAQARRPAPDSCCRWHRAAASCRMLCSRGCLVPTAARRPGDARRRCCPSTRLRFVRPWRRRWPKWPLPRWTPSALQGSSVSAGLLCECRAPLRASATTTLLLMPPPPPLLLLLRAGWGGGRLPPALRPRCHSGPWQAAGGRRPMGCGVLSAHKRAGEEAQYSGGPGARCSLLLHQATGRRRRQAACGQPASRPPPRPPAHTPCACPAAPAGVCGVHGVGRHSAEESSDALPGVETHG